MESSSILLLISSEFNRCSDCRRIWALGHDVRPILFSTSGTGCVWPSIDGACKLKCTLHTFVYTWLLLVYDSLFAC